MLRFLCFILLLISSMQFTSAQSSYQFEGKDVRPGTSQNFIIPIVTGADSTFIPVTVFNGAESGKTLGITAGVHGYEYSPILAGQKLIKSINPKQLTGVVILVQIANVESFKGRSPYVSPVDHKNLNRSFPGSVEGTNTEKVADFITRKIIAKADYFMDMHSGDAPEDLFPYGAYYSNSRMPQISQTGKDMAISLGFDHVVKFDTDGKKYMDTDALSLYCTAEAFKRNIPSIDIECGRLGLVEKASVEKIESSVLRLLRYLKFLPGKNADAKIKSPVIINHRTYLTSNSNGFFYPLAKAGDHVRKGAELGYITNYFGETIERFYAKQDGMILMIIGTPPINKNEDLIVLATPGL